MPYTYSVSPISGLTWLAESEARGDEYADLGLPITYQALVVEYTSRCNAKCGMCYQAAGPKGSDLIGDHALSLKNICDAIDGVTKLPQVGRRFHISGGEAFLDQAKILAAVDNAHATNHFFDLSVTTNGYWAKTKKRASQVAKDSAMRGLTMMEISWDVWHGPYISGHTVSNAIEACAEYGLDVHLRILTSKSDSAADALGKLRTSAIDTVVAIHSAPVMATGLAVTDVPESDIFRGANTSAESGWAINGACHPSLNLTINARGDVFPCCAGVDQTDGLALWNIKTTPLEHIVKAMNGSKLYRELVFRGVSSFAPLLLAAGIPLREKYTGICEFCYDIFSRPEAAKVVLDRFDNEAKEVIEALLKSLSSSETSMVQA